LVATRVTRARLHWLWVLKEKDVVWLRADHVEGLLHRRFRGRGNLAADLGTDVEFFLGCAQAHEASVPGR
jgi:hypothetical protein